MDWSFGFDGDLLDRRVRNIFRRSQYQLILRQRGQKACTNILANKCDRCIILDMGTDDSQIHIRRCGPGQYHEGGQQQRWKRPRPSAGHWTRHSQMSSLERLAPIYFIIHIIIRLLFIAKCLRGKVKACTNILGSCLWASRASSRS